MANMAAAVQITEFSIKIRLLRRENGLSSHDCRQHCHAVPSLLPNAVVTCLTDNPDDDDNPPCRVVQLTIPVLKKANCRRQSFRHRRRRRQMREDCRYSATAI